MNDKTPFFIITDFDERNIEAMVLFATLLDHFKNAGISFGNKSIGEALDISKFISEGYIKQINEKLVKRIASIHKEVSIKMSLYHIYYAGFIGYFEEFPPDNIEDVYRAIVSTFLIVVSQMIIVTPLGVSSLKNLDVLDNTAKLVVESALEAYKSTII